MLLLRRPKSFLVPLFACGLKNVQMLLWQHKRNRSLLPEQADPLGRSGFRNPLIFLPGYGSHAFSVNLLNAMSYFS